MYVHKFKSKMDHELTINFHIQQYERIFTIFL